MNRILCIADSLGLPGHLNKYEDTWLYKLKQEFPEYDFISYFKRQLTTDVLVSLGGGKVFPKGSDCLEVFEPDIAIIQLGIVDCAPRLLNRLDKVIIKLLPQKITPLYIGLLKKIRKRNINNTAVSFEKFKSNLLDYINRAQIIKTKVIFIEISIPDKRMINKNKDIINNVNKFNNYYRSLTSEFSHVFLTKALSQDDADVEIYTDGYHPNKEGNKIIYNRILNTLNEFS